MGSDMHGIEERDFDGHHQQLVAYIQLLEDRTKREERGVDAVQAIVDSLAEYTAYHFGAEEALMQRLEYPNYFEHKAVHAAFLDDMAIFKREFINASPAFAVTLLTYLKDWLLEHILNIDMHFGDFLKAHLAANPGAETATQRGSEYPSEA